MSDLFIPRRLDELDLAYPPELDHISASSLKMAVRCPEQWRQRYVKGLILPPAAALIAGRADHQAIEHSMEQKITSYVDLPVKDVQEKFLDAFDKEVEASGGVGEIEVKKGSERVTGSHAKRQILGEMKREGYGLVATYHTIASPEIQPISVEESFVLKPKGIPVNVEGRLDLLAFRNGKEIIIDRKRRGGWNKAPEPEWRVQAQIYQLYKQVPHEWHVTYTKNGSLNLGEGAYTLHPNPSWQVETMLAHVVGEIGYFYRKYGPDEPWPARGTLHTWACNYCGFRDGCWAWQTG